MSIINQDNYYYIESSNRKNVIPNPPQIRHGGWPGTSVRNWDDKDYWYVEFVNGDAFYHFPIEKLVPNDILQKIMSGEVTLCISNLHEAYHYVIDDIYQTVVIDSKIPVESILYLTNSADIDIEIDYISKKYNLPKIKSEFISLFELVAKRESEMNTEKFATDTLNKTHYDRKFITLNGLWRPHRLSLVSLLEALKIREQGYVSLNASSVDFPTTDEMFPDMLKWNENNPDAYRLLIENESSIKKLDRLFIDTTSDPNAPWHGAVYASTDKQYYENTYFSIVTETLCNNDFSSSGYILGRAISEKTFKPVLNRHPFILVGVKGILRLMKELGYKTFSPYIDESYDEEEDSHKRVYMIAKEAERLSKLEGTELSEFLEACKSIVEYNYQHLQTREIFSYSMT